MNRIEQLYNEWQSLLPLKPEDQSRLDRKFMLEFNYNSNHIEGNTLTYGQTELLLLFGKVVDEANMKDLEEMKAHNVCLKMMQTEAAEKDKKLLSASCTGPCCVRIMFVTAGCRTARTLPIPFMRVFTKPVPIR